MTSIFGLKAAIDLGIKSLDVFEDSALVISQIKGEWETKHPNLIPYKEHVLTLLPYFEQITFENFPREENHPFLAKTQLHAYCRKVKINRGLVKTLRNFGDTLNVLYEMSMQKFSRKLFT